MQVVEMGDVVASMIDLAGQGLSKRNQDVLLEVSRLETQVNRAQLEIDRDAIRLLTVYGPVAGNLRFVLMVSKINSELERIADQAVNMCEYLQLLVDAEEVRPAPECSRMAQLTQEMLRGSLEAFLREDRAKAEAIMAQDDLVDALNHEVLQRCLRQPQNDIARAVAEILLARSLERIADQTTNICEEVIYIVSGEDIRHSGPPRR
jgi:phosphate transport system protein